MEICAECLKKDVCLHCYTEELEGRIVILEEELDKLTNIVEAISNYIKEHVG